MEFDTLWLVHWPYFKLILFKSISHGICRPHSACFGFSRSSGKMILDWIKGLYNFIFLLISINTWPVYQNQAYNGIWLFRHWICIQVNAFISKSQCFLNSEKWYKRIRCHIRKPWRDMWIFKKKSTQVNRYIELWDWEFVFTDYQIVPSN